MSEPTKTSVIARALQGVWVAAPLPIGWAVVATPRVTGRATGSVAVTLAELLLAAAWAAGLVAVIRLRPETLAVPRIAGSAAAVWGGIGIAGEVGPAAAALATWGLIVMILSGAPQVMADSAARLAPPHEVRLPLATPLGLMVGMVVPAGLLAGFGAGLVPALLLGFRAQSWVLAIGVAGLLALFAVSVSLSRMAKRWLVVVPAGVVLHDPLLLDEMFRILPSQIAWVELAPPKWRRIAAQDDEAKLADVTGGCASRPVVVVLGKPIPGPVLRSNRGRAPEEIAMIACRPSDRGRALATLRAAGYERPEGPDASD